MQQSYTTPVGKYVTRPLGKDPVLHSSIPKWLAKDVHESSYLVAVSCAACTGQEVFESMNKMYSESIVVLLEGATPGEVKDDAKLYPHIHFLAAPAIAKDINAMFSPRLYHIDSHGSFDYIQSTYRFRDQFLDQFHHGKS